MLDHDRLREIYDLIAAPYKPMLIERFKEAWGIEPSSVDVDLEMDLKGIRLVMRLSVDTRTIEQLAKKPPTPAQE